MIKQLERDGGRKEGIPMVPNFGFMSVSLFVFVAGAIGEGLWALRTHHQLESDKSPAWFAPWSVSISRIPIG